MHVAGDWLLKFETVEEEVHEYLWTPQRQSFKLSTYDHRD